MKKTSWWLAVAGIVVLLFFLRWWYNGAITLYWDISTWHRVFHWVAFVAGCGWGVYFCRSTLFGDEVLGVPAYAGLTAFVLFCAMAEPTGAGFGRFLDEMYSVFCLCAASFTAGAIVVVLLDIYLPILHIGYNTPLRFPKSK
jgi:hypothetical protein